MLRQLARRLIERPATATAERQRQIALALAFRQHTAAFTDVEFSTFSQNGEDGMLLYLFARIGTTTKRVIELGAGDGIECNATNLVVHHGWNGLLIDGDPSLIAKGQQFYASIRNPWRFRRTGPTLAAHWITRDTINDLIAQKGFVGEVDLLSLDLDGVDYWIWDALTIRPRAVILEYNNRWSAAQSVTVPYADRFAGDAMQDKPGYFGASLAAFANLGARKGYRLVGCNSPNTNAIFLRDDVGVTDFPTVPVAACLDSDYAQEQHRTKYPLIQHLPVVEIPHTA